MPISPLTNISGDAPRAAGKKIVGGKKNGYLVSLPINEIRKIKFERVIVKVKIPNFIGVVCYLTEIIFELLLVFRAGSAIWGESSRAWHSTPRQSNNTFRGV